MPANKSTSREDQSRANASARSTSHVALDGFHEPVREWFASSFNAPTRAQELGWPAIIGGESTLLLAPTGSGKTLAAFLAAIDHLMFTPIPAREKRCRVLYVSPLKALAVDVERNLRGPLNGVAATARRMGVPFHEPTVAVRTGDTPTRERAAFLRNSADILITTPESLYLMVTSNARERLESVRWVIIDEIHAMVNSKRGAHLALTLERLELIADSPLQRIGLSATQRPLDEVARFLGGFADTRRDEPPMPRPIKIVDAGSRKELDICVTVPVEDMASLSQNAPVAGPDGKEEAPKSIWPAIQPMLLEEIRKHRSTLIFVNSRRLAERLSTALNELAGEDIVRAHHGSISREQRTEIEDDLKAGRLPALVATSSLELGIDMGAIDLVIQVESPPSVASGLQRIGRAGHQVGAPSKGIILPKYRGDLLACAALTERMEAGAVEEMRYPRNPLDVLAQQIVAAVSMDDYTLEELSRMVRRAAPFAELSQVTLENVLDMLSGRYPSDDFAELRPRITWDRIEGTLTSRLGSRRIAISNGGTIPDRGLYGVFLLGADRGKGRVGELDEEMVFETHVGDTFLLGASSWRVEEITHDRVLVSPAPGVPGKMPFWRGESAGRPLEFGRAIGKLTRTLGSLSEDDAVQLLIDKHNLSDMAARNLLTYLDDQREAAGAVPDDKTIVVESSQDEMGDWRICILSPFGGKVLAPWAMAIGGILRDAYEFEIDVIWTDDGIVVRFPDNDRKPDIDSLIPDPAKIEELVVQQLVSTGGHTRKGGLGAPVSPLFASRFREAAGRALLLPRRSPGQRAPLWQQRRKASELLAVTAKYGSFPIVLEAVRECLMDIFDIPSLRELLTQVRTGEVRVVTLTTRVPSPFAAALLFNYVSNFVYDLDSTLAERRAQALTVDPAQLRELLGTVELRDLLDGDSLAEIELTLSQAAPDRAIRHPDALHDLLLRIGDLSEGEIMQRVTDQRAGQLWIEQLTGSHRIAPVMIAGTLRYIAAEEAGRFRDALGVQLPQGLPAAFLESTGDPLAEIVSRYARTHGPFHVSDIAVRYGVGTGPVQSTLRRLEADGRVVEGEFRPGASGREWCDAGVLRSLRQKSLARLRREVEAVEADALGRFAIAWHEIGGAQTSQHALLDVIEQLQGAAIPASVLEREVLPARLRNYSPRDLDELTASGAVVWVGRESIGQHDGRISLYLASEASLLIQPPDAGCDGPVHAAIREHLSARGASFFAQIAQAVGGFPPDILSALWDMVWCGEVTNDTLQPLRGYVRTQHERSKTRQSALRLRSRVPSPIVRGAGHAGNSDSSGRWSLIDHLIFGEPTAAQRATALALQLLERHGVVTRETVQAEGVPGGFSAVYPVLKLMEEAGTVRRGYFVRGLGAAQFALPAAVDRLRALRDPKDGIQITVLAATDPANPHGATLHWPETSTARKPMRIAGASVILANGALAAWIGKGERSLLTFLDNVPGRDPEEVAIAVAKALAETGDRAQPRMGLVADVDGEPAIDSRLAIGLLEAGYTRTGGGFTIRRPSTAGLRHRP